VKKYIASGQCFRCRRTTHNFFCQSDNQLTDPQVNCQSCGKEIEEAYWRLNEELSVFKKVITEDDFEQWVTAMHFRDTGEFFRETGCCFEEIEGQYVFDDGFDDADLNLIKRELKRIDKEEGGAYWAILIHNQILMFDYKDMLILERIM